MKRQLQQQLMQQGLQSAGQQVAPVVVVNPPPLSGLPRRFSNAQIVLAVAAAALGYYGLRQTWHAFVVPLLRRWLLRIASPLGLEIHNKASGAVTATDGLDEHVLQASMAELRDQVSRNTCLISSFSSHVHATLMTSLVLTA